MTILLSIKPKYVKEILKGSKKSIFKNYDKNELLEHLVLEI
ncbi:putative transcriptional regulator [Methanococcus maripaludis]|uniref:Putative transcriptional regulator n=1 Tax=Methanococcus maripaludis TaxID=39152 RepID=A0A7J9PML1_METMI|nr:putative transcriptional regulator [Methanococcus maripaludis]